MIRNFNPPAGGTFEISTSPIVINIAPVNSIITAFTPVTQLFGHVPDDLLVWSSIPAYATSHQTAAGSRSLVVIVPRLDYGSGAAHGSVETAQQGNDRVYLNITLTLLLDGMTPSVHTIHTSLTWGNHRNL